MKERREIQMLSCSPAKLRVFVKSQRVPIGVADFSTATPVGQWGLSRSPTRAVLYGRTLDDEQARLVEDARQLSSSNGVDLEIIDLGRMGALRRAFTSRFIGPGLATASAAGGTGPMASSTIRTLS